MKECRFHKHLPEYLMEAALLGTFMISACGFTMLLEHPQSPVLHLVTDPMTRRVLMALAMGATAILLIGSPWGQRSGAHMNPAVTLAFYRLGRIHGADATAYVAFQFIGAVSGVALVSSLAAGVSHPAVNFAATKPGVDGLAGAWAAEFIIGFVMMTGVLAASNSRRFAPYTRFVAGALLTMFITATAHVSGTSLNPARSTASNVFAGAYGPLWIYFTAPPIGMLAAARLFEAVRGSERIYCAKLHHTNSRPCIFRCRFAELTGVSHSPATAAMNTNSDTPGAACALTKCQGRSENHAAL